MACTTVSMTAIHEVLVRDIDGVKQRLQTVCRSPLWLLIVCMQHAAYRSCKIVVEIHSVPE